MKIINKLTVALVLGTSVILGVNGCLRVRRERRFFEAERIREHEMVGRSLQAAVAATWKADGEAAALAAIDAASGRSKSVAIRWIPLEPGEEARADFNPAALQALRTNEPVTVARPPSGSPALWTTYVPLDAAGVQKGVIELTEPPSAEVRFLRNVLVDSVAMALALMVVSALVSFVMGQWLVGTPVRALSEKARRIGRGDFSGPVALKQRDELADLAREINAMCERLVTTVDQLRHADRLATVGKLASGVAHELGTPLNVVGARARMVSDGETTAEESREYAEVIVTATERMTQTIGQLLQFARRSGPERAPRDLRLLTSATVELLRPLAKQAHSELVVASTDGDVTASVDGGQFQQVVTNLVMNAIQAMPRGGIVNLSLQRETVEPPADMHRPMGEYLCLRVTDEGEGIAQEDLPHIFEPFFTTKDVGQGTGLGLAVAYGIIQDHGGWIAVGSGTRKGATFSVYLPAEG
ncbi:MAG: sensor histidine kinase [Polyangiaceae bacterium]